MERETKGPESRQHRTTPVLRRPDAGEGVHGPARRERHALRCVVPEHADRDAVHEPLNNNC
jgi:hypothetical protein